MIRRLVRGAIGLFLALLLIALGLVFWPAPNDVEGLRCPASDDACEVVAGRVLYALQKDRADPSRPLHLVLASRQSVSAPGISVVKIPTELRPARSPRIGAWVAVSGSTHRGSNGQTNLSVERLARRR